MAIPGSKGLANRAWTALITDVHDSGFSDIMLEGPLSTWKHTHKFLGTANQTVIRDDIEFTIAGGEDLKSRAVEKNSGALEFAGNVRGGTEIVASKVAARHLEKVFADRARRVEADLNFQARYADVAPQTIVIAGASGMVGQQVSALLTTGGHTVRALVRRNPEGENEYAWNPDKGEIDETALIGADAVIHLGGASINTRFNEKNKKKILESRTTSTGLLARTIQRLKGSGKGPKTLWLHQLSATTAPTAPAKLCTKTQLRVTPSSLKSAKSGRQLPTPHARRAFASYMYAPALCLPRWAVS